MSFNLNQSSINTPQRHKEHKGDKKQVVVKCPRVLTGGDHFFDFFTLV